jgi:hypothetical protein
MITSPLTQILIYKSFPHDIIYNQTADQHIAHTFLDITPLV